jgi:PBSX family phage terminase large subunit
MRIDFDIELNDKQIDMYNALNSGLYSEALFYGASRSGKTFLIIYWMIIQSVVYGANCLVARNTLSSMVSGMIRQTMPAVLKAIAKLNGKRKIEDVVMSNGRKFCEFNGRDFILKFFNDAYIQFASLRGSADTETSYDKILSTEWGHIFVDEVSEVDEQAIDILRSRLAQRLDVRNMMLFALNPPSKLHWTYVRFFEHRTRDGEPIKEDRYDRFLRMHFSMEDNKKYIAESYEETLRGASSMQRKRFYDGQYADEAEGEIFREITWGKTPAPEELQKVVIYTDPSAKDQKTNDYKATVMLGLAHNKVYLLDLRAVQGTSKQMLENIYELYYNSPIPNPYLYMENKQLPLDFKVTYEQFQSQRNWVCPMAWDERQMGDKFTMIESTLEPLFSQKRFIFCEKVRDSGVCEVAIDQFVRFSKKINKDRKDDIPDACAKGTSILMRDIRPQNIHIGETTLVKRGRLMTM